jgi:hypothetical protein
MVFTAASPRRRLVVALASGRDPNRGVCLATTVLRMASPRTPRRPPRRRRTPHERESSRAGKKRMRGTVGSFPHAGMNACARERAPTLPHGSPPLLQHGERERDRERGGKRGVGEEKGRRTWESGGGRPASAPPPSSTLPPVVSALSSCPPVPAYLCFVPPTLRPLLRPGSAPCSVLPNSAPRLRPLLRSSAPC